jgi:hypothetical protein
MARTRSHPAAAAAWLHFGGAVAQLGERLVRNEEVFDPVGSASRRSDRGWQATAPRRPAASLRLTGGGPGDPDEPCGICAWPEAHREEGQDPRALSQGEARKLLESIDVSTHAGLRTVL